MSRVLDVFLNLKFLVFFGLCLFQCWSFDFCLFIYLFYIFYLLFVIRFGVGFYFLGYENPYIPRNSEQLK